MRLGAGWFHLEVGLFSYRSLLLTVLLLAACEPAEDVRVLPLPPLERITPEARLGLPEIAGTWRFAGWEIVRGDTTALERTFPSFGALNIQVQRLDSVAGTFELGGGTTPIVGEVRRDGWVALATMNGGVPTAYVTGRFGADTLWLELTSIMPADEWPRDARAAFVQDAGSAPIVWLRGTIPGQPSLPPTDSLGLATDSLGLPMPPVAAPQGVPAAPAGRAPTVPARPPQGTPGAGQTQPTRPTPSAPPSAPPSGRAQPPAVRQPVTPPPPPPPPPPSPPPTVPQLEPEAVPLPETDEGPPLLGVPIQ